MFLGEKVLDVHGHVSPPMLGVGMVNMMLRATNTAADPLRSEASAAQFGLDDAAWATSVGTHVQALDEREVDVQLIGPRPFLMSADMAAHVFPTWTRFVNDTIAQQCRMEPSRFVGACQLPQDTGAPDAGHTLPELRRSVDDLGFIAVYVSPDPLGTHGGPGLADHWWDPLYAECQARSLPVIVHGTTTIDPRVAHVPHNYQLSFVAEEYWASQALAHSDVFDRFPDLRVIVCHCGGALDRWIPTDPHLSQRDLKDNLFYDTCAHDVHFLEAAIKQRTPLRMLFGTEAPGSGSTLRPESGRPADDLVPVIGAFDFIGPDQKRQIFSGNAARLLPLMAKV